MKGSDVAEIALPRNCTMFPDAEGAVDTTPPAVVER